MSGSGHRRRTGSLIGLAEVEPPAVTRREIPLAISSERQKHGRLTSCPGMWFHHPFPLQLGHRLLPPYGVGDDLRPDAPHATPPPPPLARRGPTSFRRAER